MTGRRRGRTGRGWDASPGRGARTGDATSGRGARTGDATSGRGAQTGDAALGRGPRVGDAAPARAPRRADTGGVEPEAAPTDPAELARQICLQQLAVRPRTRAELATALRRRGIDERVVAEVLDRYHDVGMVDDAAFARAWVTSRHHSKGLARRALGSELRRRGVAPEAVAPALDQLDGDTEAATARALVDRKLRGMTGAHPPEVIVRRLVGMLARKGYPAGLAFRVVKEALAAEDHTAPFAESLDPDALADAAGADEPSI